MSVDPNLAGSLNLLCSECRKSENNKTLLVQTTQQSSNLGSTLIQASNAICPECQANQNVCSECQKTENTNALLVQTTEQSSNLGQNFVQTSNSICPECKASENVCSECQKKGNNSNLLVQTTQQSTNSGQNLVQASGSICQDCQISQKGNVQSIQQKTIITEQKSVEVKNSLCPECGKMTDEHL